MQNRAFSVIEQVSRQAIARISPASSDQLDLLPILPVCSVTLHARLDPHPASPSRRGTFGHDTSQATNARHITSYLHAQLQGWQAYFSYGTLKRAYSEVDWYVANRVRHFLRRRHKVRSRGSRQFSTECVWGDRKVLRLGWLRKRAGAPHAYV